jgi:hypothetical protein
MNDVLVDTSEFITDHVLKARSLFGGEVKTLARGRSGCVAISRRSLKSLICLFQIRYIIPNICA